MVDLLKRFGHVIAAIAIAWYGYSALDAGKGGFGSPPKPLRIPQSALPLRAPDEALEVKGDCFFRPWSPYGPEYSQEAIAAKRRAAQEQEEAAIKAKRDARIKEREKAAKTRAAAEKASGATAFRPFTLLLESVLQLPGGGVARISGRTVRVGEKITGLDAKAPPVLAAVSGTTAEIDYRGERIVLDISGRATHQVRSLPAAETPPDDAQKPAAGPDPDDEPKADGAG